MKQLKDATEAAAIEVSRGGDISREADAGDVATRLGWPVRKVVALWRAHAAEIGGTYHPARYRRADPRAFNAYARSAAWIAARFVLASH